MFFDRYQTLCSEKGVSVYKACEDIGLNRSAVAKWKKGNRPNGTTAAKFAAYFGVTTDFLLCDAPEPQRNVTDDDIKFALFGGDGESTDDMYDEVQRFAAFVKMREAEKQE